jgi:hypothetical protein
MWGIVISDNYLLNVFTDYNYSDSLYFKSMMDNSKGLRLFVAHRSWHLLGWNSICQSDSHLRKLFISSCSSFESASFWIFQYNAQSSANTCTVWDPFTNVNIQKLESVQRRSARFVMNDYRQTSSVTTMLNTLQWQPLAERRTRCKAVLMYRMDVNIGKWVPKLCMRTQAMVLLALCSIQLLFFVDSIADFICQNFNLQAFLLSRQHKDMEQPSTIISG